MTCANDDMLGGARGTGAPFGPTQWSIVLAARGGLTSDSGEALATLCRSYWFPIYSFIRRRGHPPHEAQDLTQDFFVHVFEHETLRRVDRTKGRFRTFLLAVLENFLRNERVRQRALKRGGGRQIVSWDESDSESRYAVEPADDATPELLFERRWAQSLVDQVMRRLSQEYRAADKAGVFEHLRGFLTGEIGPGMYEEAASGLGMSDGAVKVAVHRLRRRFGEMLRSEVAQTVNDPADVADELRHLLAALGR